MTTNDDPFYADAKRAAHLSGVGKTKFYEAVKNKTAPQPVLVCGVKRWVVADLKRQHLANSTTKPSSPA